MRWAIHSIAQSSLLYILIVAISINVTHSPLEYSGNENNGSASLHALLQWCVRQLKLLLDSSVV